MDAFEQIVAMLLEREGYWVRRSYRVELTPQDKAAICRPSCPRWEIDVLAYRPKDNELLVVECKSFLDSIGVRADDLAEDDDPEAKGRYKLFTEPSLRKIVITRLTAQLEEYGLVPQNTTLRLAMAVGKFKNETNERRVKDLFKSRDWALMGPDWLHTRLRTASSESYENDIAFVVSKLLVRHKVSEPA